MVARETPPQRSNAPTSDPLSLVQQLLSRAVWAMLSLARRAWAWISALGRAIGSMLSGQTLCTPQGRRAALALGPVAVVVGAALSVALAPRLSGAIDTALAIVVALAWSGARLVVLRVAGGTAAHQHARGVNAAWAAGLLPNAAGVSPTLRAISWIASLLLTRVYLDRATEDGVDSQRMMLWVAGFEIVAALGLWVTGAVAPIIGA